MKRRWLLAFSCLLAAASPSPAADAPLVAATLFPLYDMAHSLAEGTGVEVVLAIPPGTEPHTWDPRPSDAPRLLAALPPRVAIADLYRDPPGHPLVRRGEDPHLWLDLANARTILYATA